MIECRSRDDDYCCEFGYRIKRDYPCSICPYRIKDKKSNKKKVTKDD